MIRVQVGEHREGEYFSFVFTAQRTADYSLQAGMLEIDNAV
jgi:hypothetical protein